MGKAALQCGKEALVEASLSEVSLYGRLQHFSQVFQNFSALAALPEDQCRRQKRRADDSRVSPTCHISHLPRCSQYRTLF